MSKAVGTGDNSSYIVPQKPLKPQTSEEKGRAFEHKATFSDKFKATKYELNAFKPKSVEFFGEYLMYPGISKNDLNNDMMLSANVSTPDLFKMSFCPPKTKDGKIISEHYSDRRANEIVHLAAGAGIMADGNGRKDKDPKFVSTLTCESGPLISFGEKDRAGNPPFKITAIDTFKSKYIPFRKKVDDYGYIITNLPRPLHHNNFMGLKASGNVDGYHEFNISGGQYSSDGQKATPAMAVGWKGFLDKGKSFFAFAEGMYTPKNKTLNQFKCGVGASLHK